MKEYLKERNKRVAVGSLAVADELNGRWWQRAFRASRRLVRTLIAVYYYRVRVVSWLR